MSTGPRLQNPPSADTASIVSLSHTPGPEKVKLRPREDPRTMSCLE